MQLDDTTICLTDDDLSCKPIVDLIDNTNCIFEYVPQELLSYVSFKTKREADDFLKVICKMKQDIIHLYYCFNCNN